MPPFTPEHRRLVETSLAYEGGSTTVDDVEAGIARGEAMLWLGPHSVIVTQLDEQPQRRILHFFLAAGRMDELEAMTPGILRWGEEQGCTVARLVGRKGWTRSFLARTGWTDTQLVIMEKPLNVHR